ANAYQLTRFERAAVTHDVEGARSGDGIRGQRLAREADQQGLQRGEFRRAFHRLKLHGDGLDDAKGRTERIYVGNGNGDGEFGVGFLNVNDGHRFAVIGIRETQRFHVGERVHVYVQRGLRNPEGDARSPISDVDARCGPGRDVELVTNVGGKLIDVVEIRALVQRAFLNGNGNVRHDAGNYLGNYAEHGILGEQNCHTRFSRHCRKRESAEVQKVHGGGDVLTLDRQGGVTRVATRRDVVIGHKAIDQHFRRAADR